MVRMVVKGASLRHRQQNGNANSYIIENGSGATIAGKKDIAFTNSQEARSPSNLVNLSICVGGIYASL